MSIYRENTHFYHICHDIYGNLVGRHNCTCDDSTLLPCLRMYEIASLARLSVRHAVTTGDKTISLHTKVDGGACGMTVQLDDLKLYSGVYFIVMPV